MGSFGKINEFDSTIESWSLYTERLEQFFLANGITDAARQRAIFLTVVGPTTYALLRNLLSPELPTAKSLVEIIAVLNAHFDPVPSEIVERFKFNSRVRRAGESVANFIAELRSLAKHCNYGTSLDQMLRDRIVCGIQDEGIQRKLLAETQLTLARATEIAVTMETAARDANNLKISSGIETNKIHLKKNSIASNRIPVPREKNPGKCGRCGEVHASNECRFRYATCHECKKIGHIAKVCRSKPKKKNSKVHNVQIQEFGEEVPVPHTLYNISQLGQTLPPVKMECLLEGKPFVFEVDSGAPFSLMPMKIYNSVKQYFPPLEHSDIRLNSYTEHSIEVLGVTQVNATFEEITCNLPLVIVSQGSVNLAGRNWIYPLKLMSIFNKQNIEEHLQNAKSCNVVSAPSIKLSIADLLSNFQELFSPALGKVKGVEVHLTRKPDVTPKFFKARPVPYALREKVEEEIFRLVKEGILEPVKTADSAAPIVPVLKQNGHIRICGDFKLTTNKVTELEQYPLPNIEDIFAQLSGGTCFSKLDLKDAYCQFQLEESSKNLVIINTHKGLFRYTRLPFGVASAPAVFQREIDKILQGLKGASCYLDDLLISGENEVEHFQNLKAVLTRLQEAGIKLHPSKCEFLKSSVEYLGHRIDKHGLHPVESKVDAILKAPDPKNSDELRSFIGLITYYAKFLPNMATLLAPLYELLKSNQKWTWATPQKQAFMKVKETLKNSSLLMHFDNNKEVVLACDASPYGLGAVLSHTTAEGDRPVAFASRSLTKAEKNYSHIEKETLALVFGVTKFRKYLLGRTFTLLTDHRPLVNLLSEDKPVPSVAAARIQRWALTLSAYSYTIKYRKGSLHANADACSRLPLSTGHADPPLPAESVLLLQEFDDTPVTRHMIASEVEKCADFNKLKSYILNGFPKRMPENLVPFSQIKNELSIEEGVIFRGSRIFIPPKFRNFVVDELHSAHQGMSAIKALARSYVWWPGIDADLEAKVKGCVACQQNASAPPVKQVSWPVPDQAWDRIHIDHAGPFEGHMLLIIIDSKTKWLEVAPVPSTSSSATIVVLRSLFARYGIPKSLVSDNGPGFSSDEFAKFLANNGIIHIKIAPYHPRSNGLAERAVRTVKAALKKVTRGTIMERLSRFLFNFRITPAASTGISPAVAMFGRPLRTRLDLLRDAHSPENEEVPSLPDKSKEGTAVWVRSYGRGPAWVPGKIVRPIGNIMSEVEVPWGTCRRHHNQLRHRQEGVTREVSSLPASSTPSVSQAEPLDGLTVDATKSPGPPVLSPQVSIDDRENSSSSATTLPVLTPQVVCPNTPLRRSKRLRQKPVRLQF